MAQIWKHRGSYVQDESQRHLILLDYTMPGESCHAVNPAIDAIQSAFFPRNRLVDAESILACRLQLVQLDEDVVTDKLQFLELSGE